MGSSVLFPLCCVIVALYNAGKIEPSRAESTRCQKQTPYDSSCLPLSQRIPEHLFSICVENKNSTARGLE